jgi:hypothetical protein
MIRRDTTAHDLFDKIRELPPDKISEVEDFVDFLRSKSEERLTARAITSLSEQSLAEIWDNSDDAEYDKL